MAGDGPAAGREAGLFFEEVFERQAHSNGLLVLKNPPGAQYCGKGRLRVIFNNLDYFLGTQAGRVAFVDCKSYEKHYFTYSEINIRPKQLERAVLLNEHQIPAGFVVYFRKTGEIVYFTGSQIALKGPKTRFTADEGLRLGRLEQFDLRAVLSEFHPIGKARTQAAIAFGRLDTVRSRPER
jgi:hypothetical protein